MKLRYRLCFEECDNLLQPLLSKRSTGYLESVQAEEQLRSGEKCLGFMESLEHSFGSMCLAQCTAYCVISLPIVSMFNKAPSNTLTTVLCGLFGLIFLALIMHSLNAKVSGFTDCDGVKVLFQDHSVTFADGEKYYFMRG